MDLAGAVMRPSDRSKERAPQMRASCSGGKSKPSGITPTLSDEMRAFIDVDSLLLAGLESGQPTPLTPDDWQEIRKEVQTRLARKLEPGG